MPFRKKIKTMKEGEVEALSKAKESGKTLKKLDKSVTKKKRKADLYQYSRYIYKVLKQVHPDFGISSKLMSIMNTFVIDMYDRILAEAVRLHKRSNSKTLSAWDIQTVVRLLLPGELAKHAVSEGLKALTKYSADRASDN